MPGDVLIAWTIIISLHLLKSCLVDFNFFTVDDPVYVSVCVCVCVCVPCKRFLGNCYSHHHQTLHSELRHKNAIHVNYIDLDLHSRSQRSDTKSLSISETFQAMPIQFAVKIVWRKVYTIFSQSNDLGLHSRSQLCLKLACTIIAISQTAFKLWHSNMAWQHKYAYLLMLVLMTPWPWCKVIVCQQRQKFSAELSQQLSKQ